MSIKMIPGQISKVDDIGIGDGPFMGKYGHARLDIFKMIGEGVVWGFLHFTTRLILLGDRGDGSG